MENIEAFLGVVKEKMTTHVSKLERDLHTIRTGRAHPQLIENIKVDYYGTPTPLKQTAAITVTDAKSLLIQPWDASALAEIDKALQNADLGTNPLNDGKVLRLTLPQMTEDRRKQLVKNVGRMAEDYKISVRNERRDAIEKIKKSEKLKEMSEDDCKRYEQEIQKITDSLIAEIEKVVAEKEKEIMTV